MPRITGRNGAMYINLTSGGTAEPIPYLSKYTLSFSVDQVEMTAFGDANKIRVSALPDASGTYNGWYDTATPQLFTAATDGISRKTYIYPDRTNATQYFCGTANFDMALDESVDGGVAISGNFSAASNWVKVG